MNKHQFITLLAFLLLACMVIGSTYLVLKHGWFYTLLTGSTLIAISLILFLIYKKIRFLRLYNKYHDDELVKKIMKRTLWQGQTAEQVIDALGKPKDIDRKVLKTKTKEIWKYFPSGRGQYDLHITLDNDEVVGWDDKL